MTVSRSLAIYGASGHGRVVADAALATGWTRISFFDRRYPKDQSNGPWVISGDLDILLADLSRYDGVVVALGDNASRLEIQRIISDKGGRIATITHPAAWVSPYAVLGAGSFVGAGANVNFGARLGLAVIVNTGASIDHDCNLADGVHVSPGAMLAGHVSVGARSWIGIGAAVRQEMSIGSDVIVGAGAVVVSSLPDGILAIGCPARASRARQ
jgi:sugar O-acyltransferase (sialic acid O-acetyltransferase NeuD family)